MFAIISAGLAPGFALLSYIYLKDEMRSEPLIEVFRTFILGAILVFPIMFIQYVLDVEQVLTSNFLRSFVGAAFLEEFFKWFVLYFTAYKFVEFDAHYDGIIYGVSVSLGFASVENILYLLAYGMDMEYALLRALLPVSSHAIFGIIMGFYMGKSQTGPTEEMKKWIYFSFFIPLLLHGIYDWILLSRQVKSFLLIPFMIFLWYLAFRKVKKAKLQKIIPIDKHYFHG